MNRNLLFLLFFIPFIVYAQHPEANRANIWYFGNGAGLDFSSGSPIAITNGALHSIESCASICDINGNLLFYTDGDTIWDRNHNVMPNGTGLLGKCLNIGNSSVQVLITPYPENNNLYYIFTTDCGENLGVYGFNYSIVDLSLNGGNGDILVKNQLLFTPSNEGVAAIYNCNRDTIWIISHKYNTNNFYAFMITNQGINTVPVISSQGLPTVYGGQMKFSPNGKKIFYFGHLYDFNITTGIISNAIPLNTFVDGYGVSFSPDSKKIYITLSGNIIIQYNIDTTDIIGSYQIIYNGISNSEYWGLQLGSDYKVYIAASDTSKISTIDFPNLTGSAAGFNPYSVDLMGRECQYTLPSFIESYFDQNYSEANCQDAEVIITIPNAFSPNADGFNDFFSIKTAGYQQIKYSIYNRWGSLLKTDEISLQTPEEQIISLWDATYKNKPVADGVYFYVIELTTFNGKHENKSGFIQIMR